MASTASSTLLLELMAAGENDSTWGAKANTNLQILESAIGGVVTLNNPGGTTTLSNANYTNDQSKKCFLYLTGTLASNLTIVVPATMAKNWRVIYLAASGGFTAALQPSGGTSRTLPQGCATELFTDGLGGCYYASPPVVLTTGAPNSATGAVASSVSFTPSGNTSSTTVQSAISELQGDIDTLNTNILTYQPLDADLTSLGSVATTKGTTPFGTGSAWTGLAVGGTDGMVLAVKSGASAGVAWASLVPAGTWSLFYQAAAPTGWTVNSSVTDYGLRIVSGSSGLGGAVLAGSASYSSIFTARTLTQANLPNVNQSVTISDPGHFHSYTAPNGVVGASQAANDIFVTTTGTASSTGSKTTGITATCRINGNVTQTSIAFDPHTLSVILASKDAY